MKSLKRSLFLFLVFLISCPINKPAEKKSYGDTIIKGEFQKLSAINPILSVSSATSHLESIIFDGLIKVDERGEPQPNLASSWDRTEDGLTWTFYLKKGVRFHDGAELTAEDVAFTYKAAKNPENKGKYSNLFKFVEDISVINKHTVEIILKRPYASFLYGLEVGILPKHLLEGKDLNSTEFNQNPIGTGPYRLYSWSENEIILKANEDYFNGRTFLNKIVIKIFPNQKVMWARLMRGEIDFSSIIFPSDYEIIKSIPFLKTHSILKPYYYMIALNLKERPPLFTKEGKEGWLKDSLFRDKRVRQALNYAVDKEKIVKEVLKGMGKVSAGTVYPLSWAYYQGIRPYPYNPQRALSLLKDAGWEDTDGNHILDKNREELKLSILINKGDEIKEKSIRLIQEQLFDIGIKLEVKLIDSPSLIKKFLQRDFESVFMEFASINDPDINYQLWHSSQIYDGFNLSSYKNQRIDELLEKGRTEFDKEKRKEYYTDFQKEIFDDPPGIFLFWTEYLVGIHERFKNVNVDWRGTFANITEWYVPENEQKYR
jgi:peptide/nickel transport system substrate-binding protein